MNFDLTGLFQRQSQIPVTDQNMTSQANVSGRTETSGANMNLSVGQIVSGQVVAVDGNVVQVEVAPGNILQGQVADGLSLLKGMSVSFEVSGISDQQIALRALFQNTANIATINKALEAAQLPQNADTSSMVNAMMKEGMPIDKASLQAMYRQVSAHPQIDSTDIVTMNRLEIPVTDANVKQFSDYMNMQHQIRGSVETITDTMTNTLMQLVSDGKTTEAAQLMKQLSVIFLGNQETGQTQNLTDALTQPGNGITDATPADPDTQQLLTENGKIVIQDGTQTAPTAADLEALMRAAAGEEQVQPDPVQTKQQMLMSDIKSLGISQQQAEDFLGGKMAGKEVLDFANQLLSGLAEKGDTLTGEQLGRFSELFRRPEMQNAMKSQMFDAWLMSPDDVADKQKVSDFYQKLSQQAGKLAEAVKNIPGADQTLANQVTNLQQNVDFMNQLNQTMSYVQLPLKLAGDNAHGDLYVYTNKKNLADNDGNVSAFLHLDMDHLGPVDVYVAMQNQKVSTQFYLRDDEMLSFIHEHIDLLNARLENKGYQMNAQFSVKEKPGNVMQEIVKDHCENVRIGTYSFDMRA